MSINKGQFGDSDRAEKVTLPVPLSSSDEETDSTNGGVLKRKLSVGNDQYESVEGKGTLTPCKQTKMDISLSKDQSLNVQINLGISVAGSSGQDIPVSQEAQGVENMMEKYSSKSQTNSVTSQISTAPSPLKKIVNFNSGVKSKLEDGSEKLNVTQVKLWKELFENALEIKDKRVLLTTADIAVIEEFLKMDIYHQYFVIKLFVYPPKWYSKTRFCSEIKLDTKISAEFIDTFVYTDLNNLDIDELLNLLKSDDLRHISNNFNVDIKCSRKPAKIIDYLKKNMLEKQSALTEDKLKEEARKRLGFCIKLKEQVKSSFYKVYVLQTYCNFWYCENVENYLKDYSKVVYPTFSIENFTPFKEEGQFLRFYQALKLQKEFNDEFKTKNFDSMKNLCEEAFRNLKSKDDNGKWKRYLPDYLQKFSAEYQYISVLKGGIKECKQIRLDYNNVKIWIEFLIEHYPTNHAIGFWHKQLAHIFVNNIKNYEAAAEFVIKALDFNKKENIIDFELNKIAREMLTKKSYNICALHREQISDLIERLFDTSKIPTKYIEGSIDQSGTPEQRMSSDGNSNDGQVAQISLKYYLDEEKYEGVHCEGKLIEILFTLFFWDIIYEYYVPRTFISKLQWAPLDMYSDSFYGNRKGEIDSRLEEIASEWSENKLETILKDTWRIHSHEKCITDLEGLGKDFNEILKMYRCIDRRVLSKILGRLVTNYKRFRNGFPNLFLWIAESSKCKFALAKVITTTDSPQPDQIQWIQFLIEVGAEVEICYVSGVGVKKKIAKGEN